MSLNKELLDNFRVLQSYYFIRNDRGRSIAYSNVITVLRTISARITDISQVKNLRGIGPNVTSKIKEYLDTGSIKAVEDKKKEIELSRTHTNEYNALAELQTIWGIGPKKAEKLYESGITSVKKLSKSDRGNTHLTRQQQIGLKYRDDIQKKVQRNTITSLSLIFKILLNKTFGRDSYDLKIAGSYRRGEPESSDIDCLITSEKFNIHNLVSTFKHRGIIVETLSIKKERFMGIVACNSRNIRLDIEFVKRDEWGSSLLYFTGSRGFNIYIRSEAKRQGYLLNEHGLYLIKSGKKILYNPTERDIFNHLGLNYISPSNR